MTATLAAAQTAFSCFWMVVSSCCFNGITCCLFFQDVLGLDHAASSRSKRSLLVPPMIVTENQRAPFPRIIGRVRGTLWRQVQTVCELAIGKKLRSYLTQLLEKQTKLVIGACYSWKQKVVKRSHCVNPPNVQQELDCDRVEGHTTEWPHHGANRVEQLPVFLTSQGITPISGLG